MAPASSNVWAWVWAWAVVVALNFLQADGRGGSGGGGIKGEPHVSSQWPASHVHREGELVRLTCPITANPEAFYDWYKDGDGITDTWNRYVPKKRLLKIKNVRGVDAGVYTCKGVNGFGRANASTSLIVLGKGEVLDNLTKPVLTEVSPQVPIHRRRGDTLTLTCRARSLIKPMVTWSKDGARLETRGEQFHLRSVSPMDAGQYTCRAESNLGAATANFTVYVEDPGSDEHLQIRETVNTTVEEGGTTSLQCSVHTSNPPRVEWLKELSPEQERAGYMLNATRMLAGRRYMMMEGVEGVVARGGGEYLTKLTLSRATPAAAGVYVCLAVNDLGFSFKKAHLTVRRQPGPEYPPVRQEERSVNWLFLIIPAVVVVVVVIAVVVCQLRKSTPDKPVGVNAPTPMLKGDDPSALTPLNQQDPHSHPPSLPRPPDLVYQEVSGYSASSVRGGGHGASSGTHYEQYPSPYPDSYLDPAYSDPYQADRGTTRSSDHGYARLTHPSLASHASSSPQLPPPYVHPHAHHAHTHTHRHPQYFVHYNL